MPQTAPPDGVRIDRWLLAARAFKTRPLCQQACQGGKVTVNGDRASAHRIVRIGDRVCIQGPRGLRDFLILALAERRLPAALARELYVDESPPPPPRVELPSIPLPVTPGRPTKRDRRKLQRFRRG